MGRGRDDGGAFGILFDACYSVFQQVPIWVGPCVAAGGVALFRWGLPALIARDATPGSTLLRTVSGMLAWAVGGLILVAWAGAELRKLKSRRLFGNATDTDSIRGIPWQEFEQLIAECYRRRGYMAEVVGKPSGDGGVDIELNGHGKQLLVQCKHWKRYKVGVREVREFHSVVISRRANGGIIATSGRFTPDAERCATDNGIELLDGAALTRMLRELKSAPSPALPPSGTTPSSTAAPVCPRCRSAMVRKTARRGKNAGSDFWGCPGYPTCTGTRPIDA